MKAKSPCPTCAATMDNLTDRLAWCCRCGTLRDAEGLKAEPFLVARCRAFEDRVLSTKDVPGHQYRLDEWARLGVADAIGRTTEKAQPAAEGA
jgi:hypothetical protein